MRARLYCVNSELVTMVQMNERLTNISVTDKDGNVRPCKYFTVDIDNLCTAEWLRENVSMVDGLPQLSKYRMKILDYGNGYGVADTVAKGTKG